MSTGVLLLNFGEPTIPDRGPVVDYLQRIFLANASLEAAGTEEEARDRARQLAERRVDGLLEEYEAIGGSPLNEQATAQAATLEETLRNRGFDATVYVGMQFTEPFIEDAVVDAIDDGMERLIGLPGYPLCGPSTTVAALSEMQDAIEATGWQGEVDELTGWHRHPSYNRLRVENIVDFTRSNGVDPHETGTTLVFSAHGTPQHYLEEGSRYREYVEEYCETQAALLGVQDYQLGYQNHENRDIPWTEPDVESVIETIDADRVIVEPVSFIHEQSETLSELDDELHEEADDQGLDFYRVPIPHDDERLPQLFADLIEPFIAGVDPGYYNLRPCRCRPTENTVCLNAAEERPTGSGTPSQQPVGPSDSED